LFSILLAITFAVWYAKERTLSIHSIFTRKREAFYWLAILFTFALGTASGDLMAEALGLGYAVTGVIIAVIITTIAISWRLGLDSVLSFWLIYILTRPLGASAGDLLTQPHKYGGLGLGATNTTIIFTATILGLVAYLSISRKDVITDKTIVEDAKEGMYTNKDNSALWQVATAMTILIVAAGTGYYWRHGALASQENNSLTEVSATQDNSTSMAVSSSENNAPAPNQSQKVSVLGDLSDFRTITQDTLNLVNDGDLPGATNRVADLEHDWDTSEAKLKPMDTAKWTEIDNAIDKVLRDLRAVHPDATSCQSSLQGLLAVLN
jgi:hypothetical protein